MLHDVMAALRAGDTALALRLASDWAKAQPGSPDAQLALAHAHNANGDNAAASKALEHGLALAPDRADLLTARGFLELANRNFDGARADLDAALAVNPNQMSAYIAAAHLAFSRGDMVEAERLITYARRIDDEHPHLLLLEAQLAELKGEEDRVLPLMSAAAQRAPNDALAQASLGLALLKRGHHAFAEQALRNALERSPSNGALRGALLSTLVGQGHLREAFGEAQLWVSSQPDSLPALWSVAQLAAQVGDADAAISACRTLVALQPRHVLAIALEAQLLVRLQGPAAVAHRLDELISADAALVDLWRMRLEVTPPEELASLIARWRLADPSQPLALEAEALLAESLGDGVAADRLAAEALALEPRLTEAALLRARCAQVLSPQEAQDRLSALVEAAVLPEQKRALRGWHGLSFHRMKNAEAAVDAWRQMWSDGPRFGQPLPNPVAANEAKPPVERLSGCLLWGPPGGRVERVHSVLAQALPHRLLGDRWDNSIRNDGFHLFRVPPNDAQSGSAERWAGALQGAGMSPHEVIDSLPHWDGWTSATLAGTRLVVVLRDPRDLLLNWMAWGSAAGLAFPGPGPAASWLRLLLEQLLEAEAADPASVHRVDADLFDAENEALSQRLQSVFGLDEAPDLSVALALGRSANGQSTDFPAGEWRLYREALKPVFDHLQPVAVRLGYPAE